MMDATEAEKCGLVTRVVPADKLQEEALNLAKKIASYSLPVLKMIKESVLAADAMPLPQGIRFERRLFQSSFNLHDRQEGMAAFAEKRRAEFKNR
jgi:enoyl-CoA hydratase